MSENNQTKTARIILNLVNSSKIQHGKVTLSKMLHENSLKQYSQEQIRDLIQQLIDQEYLKHLHIGTDFDMVVLGITEKGKEAAASENNININLPQSYSTEFISAAEVGVVNKDLINEYYKVKLELTGLLKKEEQLKNIIKKQMIDNGIQKITAEKIDLFCRKVQRILYPKKKIEEFVPEEIREKIREIKETIVLSVKLK